MSEQRHGDWGPREERVRKVLRGLPGVAPEPDFRARLRENFVSGALDRERSGKPRAPVLPLFRWGVPLAAAAALIAAFVLVNRGPEWRSAGMSGEGQVRIGGTTLTAPEVASELEKLLRSGATVEVEGEAPLDLHCEGTLAIQMAPGSRLTLPNSPGRWVGRAISCRVEQGEVRFVTGPAFEGAHLEVTAPAARIEVSGTTFAVISAADSTCVCVLDGEVKINCAVVEDGMRRTVFPGREDGFDEEIYPMERMKLEMLRTQATTILGAKASKASD
jgi:ferric-dicitrate binding protein FerR (iron transport regulator)